MTTTVRAVAVALTSGCNLRCIYCYQRRTAPRRMRWRHLRAACDVLLAADAAEPEMTFCGGEPTLEWRLVRRAVAYLEERSTPARSPRVRLTTNGTLLGAAEVRFLAAHRVRTVVSSDGVEAAQRLRGAGTFDRLDDLLVRLHRDYPGWFADDVTVAMTLSSANLDRVAASVRYFLGRGVSTIELSPVVTHDPGWDDGCYARLQAQFAAVRADCLAHLRATGTIPFVPLRRLSRRRARPRRDVAMCRIADGQAIFVDVNGEVHACGALSPLLARLPTPALKLAAEAAHIGPITAPDLTERLAAARRALRVLGLFDGKECKRSAFGACGVCPALQECRVCPLSIAHRPSGADPDLIPPLPCAFNLLVARHRRRFPAAGHNPLLPAAAARWAEVERL